MTILVAEDELELNQVIVEGLEKAGFEVDSTLTAAEAAQKIRGNEHEVLILDWVFPNQKLDGLDLLNLAKRKKRPPFTILLSGRVDLNSKLRGLSTGADFYLTKPFFLKELLARLETLLRGKKKFGRKAIYRKTNLKKIRIRIGEVIFEPTKGRLFWGKKWITLTSKEHSLLCFFLKNRDKKLQPAEIIQNVWQVEPNANSANNMNVHLHSLRKKLGPASHYLKTIPQKGYCLIK